MTRGRTYPGSIVVHSRACACQLCDPGDTKLKARRAAHLDEEKARAAQGAPPPAPTRSGFPVKTGLRAGARPPTNETRRLAELLKTGIGYVRAIEIIEAEKLQPKGTP